MENHRIEKLNTTYRNYSLEEAFHHLLQLGFKNMAFSTSFGQEDQVIANVIFKNDYPIEVFTLDTGMSNRLDSSSDSCPNWPA